MLFKRKQKKSGIEVIFRKSFVQSRGFRGFTRMNLATYGDKRISNDIKQLMKSNPPDDPFNIEGRTIELEVVQDDETSTTTQYYLNVYVDGLRVGSWYRGVSIDDLNLIDKVYVRISSDDEKIYSQLFIHKS